MGIDAFRSLLIRCVRAVVRRAGIDIVRWPPPWKLPDADAKALSTTARVRERTMTSSERIYALIEAVRYISAAGIEGDIVECGVWRGGSMMAAAITLLECGDVRRHLYLFDTFEGMTAPGAQDVDLEGQTAVDLLAKQRRRDPKSAWCYATLEDVTQGMSATKYDVSLIHFIKGRVENVLPSQAPSRIALLRLDTDWYESTRHELEHLYPRLVPGGVLIIDDYGHWAGARKAVDEYFAGRGIRLHFARIDYSGRIAVKPGREPGSR